jgi:hypothetical protein
MRMPNPKAVFYQPQPRLSQPRTLLFPASKSEVSDTGLLYGTACPRNQHQFPIKETGTGGD